MADNKKNINTIEEEEEQEGAAQPQKKGAFLSPFLVKILSLVAAGIGVIIISVLTVLIMTRCAIPSGGATSPDTDVPKREKRIHLEYLKIDDPFRQQLIDGRMIQLKLSLGYKAKDKKVQQELTQVIPEIRDIIIKHLSRLKSDYFQDEHALDRLEEDLLKQINRILNEGKVEKIFFLEYTLM
ncbi:MAG TPA: flagellar basal body-associated FliL family protein [Spirochaetota bacterium]|nr:flagellar basal body-associated FliL family protein [Spirochaetota bacterium]HPP03770.1 flagellar basal body-associated FliL family protein [Spirochaetota bacterium]